MKKHGNTGNVNAAKDEPKNSTLIIRCTQKDKAKWVKAAGGKKLSSWVTQQLNDAAD